MTGSILPSLAALVMSRVYFSSAWYLPSGYLIRDALAAADFLDGRVELLAREPELLELLGHVVVAVDGRQQDVLGRGTRP